MYAIRNAALAAAFSLAAAVPAPAMTVADLANGKEFAAPAAFATAEPSLPGRPSRLDRVDAETARAAVESYFDYDALITLGVLAIAGGALAAGAAAAAKRKSAEEPVAEEPAWRESVFTAIQADLAQYTDNYRRAA